MSNKIYSKWQDFPMAQWRWKNFQPWEVACKDGLNGTPKSLLVRPNAMDALQKLRELMGAPIIVTSAYRTPTYNKRIGGVKNSQHIKAYAFDIIVSGHDPAKLYAMGKLAGFNAFGFYERSGFIHMDVRAKKVSWGKKWFGDYVERDEVKLPDIIPTPKPIIVEKPIPEPVKEALEDGDKEWWKSKTNLKWLLTGGLSSLTQIFTDPSVQKMIIGLIAVIVIYGLYERSRKAKLSRKAKQAMV